MTLTFQPIIVFAGPSIPEGGLSPLVNLRPPASRGVLKELADQLGSAAVVVFLDGMFFHEPAPTHYDLLYLLRSGAQLIGASSMGALRAAELRNRGMVGIGIVYEALIKGIIRDDSELAVAMCPFTYRALTVPLVRIRRVLYSAISNGLSDSEARVAFEHARRIHFLERTPIRVSESWKSHISGTADALSTLLTHKDSDVKAADAELAIQFAIISAIEVVQKGSPQLPLASYHQLPLWH